MAVNPLFAGLAMPVDTPSRLTLLHPVTRKPIVNKETGETAWIDLVALTGAAGTAHERVALDRIIKMKGRRPTAREVDDSFYEKLGRITVGWNLLDTETGTPLNVPFSEENAQIIYSDEGIPWIREAVMEFASDLGNFPRRASSS